ncbi:MAG: hypothetical protein RJB01_1670 [Actinomycetota bacterium]
MKRSQRTLADGRTILYFDNDERGERAAVDTRELPPLPLIASELRHDRLTGDWVIIADHRQERTHHPSLAECPLCPSRTHNATEIPEEHFEVVIFENRFPSLPGMESDAGGIAGGRAEVVAFTQDHEGSLGNLSSEQMKLVILAWIDRCQELACLPGTRSVFVFENRGEEIGVTLHHPHGQIYAYPFLPPYQEALIRQALMARERGDSLIADTVQQEIDHGSRIIVHNDYWVAFAPYASSWPLEIQLHPVRDIKRLPELNEDEINSLAVLYPHLIRSLDGVYDKPMPYMAGWIQTPCQGSTDEHEVSRLFLRLVSNQRSIDKLKYLASSETLMGAFILDVSPESAAELVRQSLANS